MARANDPDRTTDGHADAGDRDLTARCVCGRGRVLVLDDRGARCGTCWVEEHVARTRVRRAA